MIKKILTHLVSVIVPCYNQTEYLPDALESVFNQTYENWECIIVNDGSTDGTKNIALDYQLEDNRIKYLYQRNGKQGKARNFGISKSKGDYIAFLDADDIWMNNKLEIQLIYLFANPKIDLLFSQGYLLDGRIIENLDVIVKSLWNVKDIPLLIEGNKIPLLSVIVKVKALIIVDCFNESEKVQYGEDYYLWLKLLSRNFNFISIEERLFFYRTHSGQVTKHETSANFKLFSLLIDFSTYYDNRLSNKAILNKLKWGIFDEEYPQMYFDFCYTMLKRYNKFFALFIQFVRIIPSKKIRNKLILRLLSIN